MSTGAPGMQPSAHWCPQALKACSRWPFLGGLAFFAPYHRGHICRATRRSKLSSKKNYRTEIIPIKINSIMTACTWVDAWPGLRGVSNNSGVSSSAWRKKNSILGILGNSWSALLHLSKIFFFKQVLKIMFPLASAPARLGWSGDRTGEAVTEQR